MARRRGVQKDALKKAQKALIYTLKVGSESFSFDNHLFDLEYDNFALINEQIARLPSDIAYCGLALAAAEREQSRMQTEFDLWMSNRMDMIPQDSKTTETAKVNRVRSAYATEYKKRQASLADIAHTCRVLRIYRDGLDSKYQLTQTLSANMRTEYNADSRHG